MKNKDILPNAATWMDLENILLSEMSQPAKDSITYTWNLKKVKLKKQ